MDALPRLGPAAGRSRVSGGAQDVRFPATRRVAGRAGRALRRGMGRAALPRSGLWVQMRLDAGQGELPAPPRRRDTPTHLLEALLVLDACANDPQVSGVSLQLDAPLAGWSAAQALRRALVALRERGVPVVAYAEQLDETGLLVASAASQLWMPETGRVHLVGVRAEGFYLRDLLSRWDIAPEVVRVGTHKSAGEMFTRDGMSPEHREQLEALVDDLYEALASGIAEGRGLSVERVHELIDRGPYTAVAAREAGLIDDCVYPDEIEQRLRAQRRDDVSGPTGVHRIDAQVYRALRADAAATTGAPAIAYVVAEGTIRRGGSGRGIGSEPLARLFEDLRTDPGVCGVALRVDSPGGDALASDLLWRALDQLRCEKPVVASMGDVAASGGYYLASAADTIFAEVASVTGSIGVIGGKLNLEGLYERLGIGRDAVERGQHAGLLSETRSFTPSERNAVREEMEALYAAFVDRVARGRGLAVDAVHRVAQGRVWSGARARGIGLVDALGGPLEAVAEARRLAGLLPGERPLLQVHPRAPRITSLFGLLRWLR